MQKIVCYLASGMMLVVSEAYADNDISDNLENVQVWGTAVKSSSVYMGSSDIGLKQADHLSDLLRTIPGVDVGGAHSLNQRITIRSLEDRDIRISIDGANQNNYMYHHMGNLQIHADILQAVDIEVGTNSVVNGGLGGSVRFETKKASELLEEGQDFGARVKATGSTNSSDDIAISIYGKTGAFDLLGYYNRVEKRNFSVGDDEIKDSEGRGIPNTDGEVRGLEGTVDSALFKAGWDINEDHRLELGYEFYKDEGDYSYRPDMGLATDIAISEGTGTPLLWPTEYTRDTITLNYDASFGSNTDFKATVYDNRSRLWRDERGYAQSTIPRFRGFAGVIEGEANNYGANFMASTTMSTGLEQVLTYGSSYVQYDTRYEATYDSGNMGQSEEDRTDTAIYLEDRIAVNSVFSLTPGIRYESVDLNSQVVEDTFSDTLFALAAEFQPDDTLVFRLSGTELFQAPELAEVFIGAGSFDTANPDIKEESGSNIEFAVAYGDKVFGADQLSLGATFFETKINDYIYDYAAPDPASPRDTLKDNIGDMTVDGFELYAGYRLGNVDALLTYSASDSELSSNAIYTHYNNARLDRVQGDTISFKLSYDIDSLDLKLAWDFLVVEKLDKVSTDLQLDGAGFDNSKPGYQVHNISVNWQPAEKLELTFGVDNVFDKYYVSQSSRTGSTEHPVFGPLFLNDYEPGRNIKATVAYTF